MLRGALLVLSLTVPCWATAQPSHAEGFAGLRPGARILVMPVDIELYEVSGGGVLEPRADWTDAAARRIAEGLRQIADTTGPDDAADETVLRVTQLHRAVGSAVSIHHYGGLKLASKDGKLDWSLGPEAALLRGRSGADYALFIWLRDSYASPARKAAMMLGALLGLGLAGGAQVAYASLVELESGRLLWFNRLSRLSGDLRDDASSRQTLEALLAGFPRRQ
jgi:hypothetical protein